MSVHDESHESTAAAVSGLAREVEALRTKLRPVEGLDKQVTDLANALAAMADDLLARNRKNGEILAPSWLSIPTAEEVDPAAVAEALDGLIGWVGHVYLAYPDAAASFPECWLWHPALLEELMWLWHTWKAAYTEDGASARLAGDWHDRFRPGVTRRVKAGFSNCSLANHTDRDQMGDGRPEVPFAEVADSITTWWVCGSHGTAPVPTEGQLERAAAAWRTGRGGRR
ncbi:hypothetical protein ACTXG6_43520 [Pseudonocardia sp. Cha107L01]|uniref:hypothetical protein n=1 Tax=Pseudonocardia sp. Cha107L01 TaxID=3457576 RepID=UPI00403ECAB5